MQDQLDRAKAEQHAAELAAELLRENESALKQRNMANVERHRRDLDTCTRVSKAEFDAKIAVLRQECAALKKGRKEDQK